jgi:hypothetical protein
MILNYSEKMPPASIGTAPQGLPDLAGPQRQSDVTGALSMTPGYSADSVKM